MFFCSFATRTKIEFIMERKPIKRALVSVYHKNNLDEIIAKLHAQGVEFVSTGGTKSFIESLEIPCTAVEDLTGYPSILGGREKHYTRKSSAAYLPVAITKPI